MIGLLLVLQATRVAPCEPAALCRLLEAAAAANQMATLAPGGYRAVAETETATLGRWEGRIQGATLLEQTSSEVRWSNDEGFTQRVVGSRSFPNAIPLSRLIFMKIGWVVPTLVGERLSVVPRNGPGETRYRETLSGPLAPVQVVHPLAADREKWYRYAAGEPAGPGLDRIEVTLLAPPSADVALFEGEMYLDAASHAVVRLRGRIRMPPSKKSLFEPAEVLVDLSSRALPGAGWVPSVQRFEIQTENSLAYGFGATRRVVSRFYDAVALPRDAGALSVGTATGYALTAARRDSLRRFSAWRSRAGVITDSARDADFGRFRPPQLQTPDHPVVRIQGFHSEDFLRLNRIEGLFTGAAVIVREAVPGVLLRATAGYAWSEKTVRGGAGARWAHDRWQLEGGVLRRLEVTNDFRDQFDDPSLGALAGRDPWDYLDRIGGGVGLSRLVGPGRRGSAARLELAWVDDRAVTRHMDKSLIGRLLRDNRNISEGSYFRTRLMLDWNPAISPVVARDGVGFRADLEHAAGDLDYTRVEARVVVRRSFRPLFLMVRLHAGAVIADAPPPQQLFELGGPAGFPGYEYKEFAGNRAVLFRTRISYPLPLLDAPIRVGRGITLPALAPAVSFGFQSGLAGTSSAAARAAVASLGVLRNDNTREVILDPVSGLPRPASVPAERLKTSVDVRVGVFGDALGVGLARALTAGRKSTFFVAIGRQF